MAKMKNNKERRNSIVWFLFAIVVPMMVALILLFFVLQIAGVDTGGWMKDKLSNTPVSKLLSSSEEKEDTKKAERAEEIIENQKEEINDLTREIEDRKSVV